MKVEAIVGTLPTDIASHAVVTYVLRAFKHAVDDEGNPVVDDQGREVWTDISGQARVATSGGWSNPVRETMNANPPFVVDPKESCGDVWPEWATELVDWTWCGFEVGVEEFATGLLQLPHLLGILNDWGRRWIAYEARIFGLTALTLLQDKAAADALTQEVIFWIDDVAPQAKISINAVGDLVIGYLGKISHLYETGDDNLFFEAGKLARRERRHPGRRAWKAGAQGHEQPARPGGRASVAPIGCSGSVDQRVQGSRRRRQRPSSPTA